MASVTAANASSDIVPDSNKCIPDKQSESGVLLVKKGKSLNKGISFSIRKYISELFPQQLSLFAIDHSYL